MIVMEWFVLGFLRPLLIVGVVKKARLDLGVRVALMMVEKLQILLANVERWISVTDDKELRRRLCRLIHAIEQDISRRKEFNTA